MRRPLRCGFTLLEVVVALVLLQLALLGVLGLFTLASIRLTNALLTERAAAEAAAVADSLSRARTVESGQTVRADWVVRWEPLEGGVAVRASRLGAVDRDPVVELRVP